MSKPVIRIGHSPDADDAFMFYGFEQGVASIEGHIIEHVIADIQRLNQRAGSDDQLEVTALSVASYLTHQSRYQLLEVGISVGRRYGPRLVARKAIPVSELAGARIALPGEGTTAALLASQLLPDFQPVQVDFDRVFDAIDDGIADAGVIIHEGQLSYAELGFTLLMDFGEAFYQRHGLPLPLGVNCVRRDLPEPLKQHIRDAYRQSVQYALANTVEAVDYALRYGRGMSAERATKFIGMYVNQDSLALSDDLRSAIDILAHYREQNRNLT